MTVSGGYRGRLLEVNLSSGVIRDVPLPPEHVLQMWIGCTGLGLYLLAKEITPTMQATDPDCPIFILTGPLTGTRAPNSSNWTIVSLNGNLPYHPGVSQAHGHWGARLKHSGWDGIVVRGASESPVYLWADEGRAELRDASPYWGLGITETTRRIQLDLDDFENVSVASIGPGGENLLPGASVRCDLAYGCNKGAPGLIWGAKKLKAIAVRGSQPVPVADHHRLADVSERWEGASAKLKGVWASATESGGLRCMPALSKIGMVQGKNFADPEFGVRWGEALARDLKKWKIKPVGSSNCDFRCHHETTITTGPAAGTVVRGYGAEVMQAMGPNLGITDPGIALALSGMLDDLGLDSSEVPRNIATVMEAYNEGILTKEDVDGLDLTWGNYEAVMELIDRIVRREGIGEVLAKGVREAGRELGPAVEGLVQHIKGIGFNDHDQRGWGLGLLFQSLVASGAGPTWQGYGVERVPEPDLGYTELQNPNSPEGKAEAAARTQMKKLWEDSLGVCLFSLWNVVGSLQYAREALSAAVGWPSFSPAGALLVGERIVVLQRLISLYRGYDPAYDFDISKRMLDPVPAGPAKGRALGPHVSRMREEYYQFLNWNSSTGAPTPEALARVGLADFKVGGS